MPAHIGDALSKGLSTVRSVCSSLRRGIHRLRRPSGGFSIKDYEIERWGI